MRWCAGFYRALLLWYPREFRTADGEAAAHLFAEACREDWQRRGASAVAKRLAASMIQVPGAGLAERREQRRLRASAQGPFGGMPGVRPWHGLGGDLRQAVRTYRRRPALAVTITVTLAVGVGTNVAIFSVLDATLLRPVPFAHAGRTVLLEAEAADGRASDPLPAWTRAWTANARALERVEARTSRSALVTGAGPATRVRMMDVSGGYLDAIGARPMLGRSIGRADAADGAPLVVELSPGFWRRYFGASPDVVGRTLEIDRQPHTIIGVADELESDIAGLTFSLAAPLRDDSPEPARTIAWLRRGVTLAQAQAELDAAPPVILRTDRDTSSARGRPLRPRVSLPRNGFWTIPVYRATELGFLAAGLLVLAIAGVNVAHLFLSVGQERAAEVSMRRALGASTFRLVRLLFAETMVLTLTGSVAGLAVAWSLIRWLKALDAGPQLQTRVESIRVDPVIVGYAMCVALFVAAAFGLWPAIRSAAAAALSSQTASLRVARRRGLPASLLMTVEAGLSTVLLVVAGVVGHAFVAMELAPRGFDADRILTLRLTLPADRYAASSSRTAFFDRLLREVAEIPGVEQAGLGYGAAPPDDFVATGRLTIAGESPIELDTAIDKGFVQPGYFRLMGVPLLQGTDFAASDLTVSRAPGAPQPVVISRSMARRFWPQRQPVDTLFQIAQGQRIERFRVIGVAGDVAVWSVLSPTCRDCDQKIYLPLPDSRRYTEVLLRLAPGVAPPVGLVQSAIARLDPDVPADDELQTSEASLQHFIRLPRFTAALFSTFAGVAIVLVAIGLSTLVSRSVARRTREIGIRLALGATPHSVRALVVFEGLRPAILGLVVGLPVALGVTRAIRALLYGFSPADPLTLVLAPALLVAIVIAALVVPALRATRVDPARSLQAE